MIRFGRFEAVREATCFSDNNNGFLHEESF